MSRTGIFGKPLVIVGLTLAIPALLLLYGVGNLWSMRQHYQGEIDALMPRAARLQGMIDVEDQLQASANRVKSRIADLVYPAEDDRSTVSAAIQKNVREIMTEAGLAVTNSQVLPVVEEDSFERIGLKLAVSGEIDALDVALSELAAYRPLVLVESIEFWPSRASRRKTAAPSQKLTVGLRLLSLREIQ